MKKLTSEFLRPTSLEDLVISQDIKIRLMKMHDTRNVMNMLFYGKPGSGKTTAAKIFTESDKFESLTINGSLETSVNDIRSSVRSFAYSISLYDREKICFIDEADYLSKNAQAGLRNLIEESSSNCRFIFTANELKKIHPALCSRLYTISFDMTASQISSALRVYTERTISMLKSKMGEIDEERVKRIIELNFPDYRTIANHLEYEFI
jgi:DNA polymerase III delta prime subunit